MSADIKCNFVKSSFFVNYIRLESVHYRYVNIVYINIVIC